MRLFNAIEADVAPTSSVLLSVLVICLQRAAKAEAAVQEWLRKKAEAARLERARQEAVRQAKEADLMAKELERQERLAEVQRRLAETKAREAMREAHIMRRYIQKQRQEALEAAARAEAARAREAGWVGTSGPAAAAAAPPPIRASRGPAADAAVATGAVSPALTPLVPTGMPAAAAPAGAGHPTPQLASWMYSAGSAKNVVMNARDHVGAVNARH